MNFNEFRSEGFAIIQRHRNSKRLSHTEGGAVRLLCTKCLKKLPETSFWKAMGGLRGKFSVCKACYNKKRKPKKKKFFIDG